MIRVLVVDDSAAMRKILCHILSQDPDIEIAGTASDPLAAREMIKSLNPDVLTLDIEMPNLDGLEFLERLMRLRPMPVVMISSLTQKGAEKSLRALELGAVEVVAKPIADLESGLAALKDEIIAKVKAAAGIAVHCASPQPPRPGSTTPPRMRPLAPNQVVAIGASTGGVVALTTLLTQLPGDGPPILVTQHMPPGFTRTFAKRLDGLCAMTVLEVEAETEVLPGHVYIAPGDLHLIIARHGSRRCCKLLSGAPVNGHRPSVDVLFASVAEVVGADAVGLLLTGMGCDGAQGLLQMRRAGAATGCQDEASALIYGMPKAAVAIGAAQHVLPLGGIAAFIRAHTRCGSDGAGARARNT